MLDFGFYNLDCMDGMKEFPDKFFDLAVCDPPYGINIGSATMGAGGGKAPHTNRSAARSRSDRGGAVITPKIYKAFDDSSTPDAAYFSELERVSKHRIIFGGNYFLDYLGKTSCLITWDKKRRGMNFADCEIAWTDFNEPCRIFDYKWNGMLQENMKEKEYRIHPTQKPVALYEWILSRYAKPGDVILDTHVGSASSLIACHNLNHKYVGFEIDPDYYAQAKARLDDEEAQQTIFGYNPYQE